MAQGFLRQGRPLQKRAVLVREAKECPEGCWKMHVSRYEYASVQYSKLLADMTSEEIREKRRAERKQFKLDRAAAIAKAAAEAEAAFAEGREATPTVIPSGATWKPQKASEEDTPLPEYPPEDDVGEEPEPVEIDNVEHLQLTLPEAFFLIWTLDCLTVLDPHTVLSVEFHQSGPILTEHRLSQSEPMSLLQIWHAFQAAHCISSGLTEHVTNRFDNPFLVNYAAYHYYRSLGWVVKGGIKFCVDLLLYKRGPVFHHAEYVACRASGKHHNQLIGIHRFAVVVIPVYEDPSDQESSPFNLQNSHTFSWSWLSTVNRVNSQVQKVCCSSRAS